MREKKTCNALLIRVHQIRDRIGIRKNSENLLRDTRPALSYSVAALQVARTSDYSAAVIDYSVGVINYSTATVDLIAVIWKF